MKAVAPLRGLAVLGVCLAVAVAGCSTSETRNSQPEFGFWQPCLLYSLSSPHPRLYVEVDAVERFEPDQAKLNKLREFLTTYCQKPGGIDLVRSDVIPPDAARGVSPNALARKYLNGPPESAGTSGPAFIYVLFYDYALSNKRVSQPGQPRANSSWRQHPNPKNPHVDLLPYPSAIFINSHLGPESIRSELLVHEGGHVLGLVGRPKYAAGYHCLDNNCLMNKTFRKHLGRWLTGRDPFTQRQLCPRCLADLAGRAVESPPTNLRFVGPVLVRSEAGYHVLSLPTRVKLIMGDLADQDCRDFSAAVRAESLSPGGENYECRVDGLIKEDLLNKPADDEMLKRAKADPLELVRVAAPRIWTQVWGQRYCAQGQFTNAVALCRRTTLADPEDYAGLNLLAWISATCSDPSVRDGLEAVTAATKACDLTQWQNWTLLDTLAAAWAEAGDFKRAVQFQEQALRAGPPAESDRKDMQARLSLYQHAQPFHEKR